MRGDGVGFPQLNLSAYHVDNDRRTSPEREAKWRIYTAVCVCAACKYCKTRSDVCK